MNNTLDTLLGEKNRTRFPFSLWYSPYRSFHGSDSPRIVL
jgi:hypothetical protein